MDDKDIPFLNAIATAMDALDSSEDDYAVAKSTIHCPDCKIPLIVEVYDSGKGTAECAKCKHKVSLSN